MSDNATAHAAADYEDEVARTIPFHAEILRLAASIAATAVPDARRWLDTGSGPGRVVAVARAIVPRADFFMADPSPAMLSLARRHNPELGPDRFFAAPSDALPEVEPFDVITAVLCHHYYPERAGRERAVRRCRALLAPGGALVVFENVRAETDAGHRLQRERWAAWMRAQGRDEASIETQLAREGTKTFPLRVSEHVALLESAGFATIEVIWRAFGQAGMLAIAPR